MSSIIDIALGVFLILIGVLVILYTTKRPKNTILSSINNFQGYAGGVGFIIIGIIRILSKLQLI